MDAVVVVVCRLSTVVVGGRGRPGGGVFERAFKALLFEASIVGIAVVDKLLLVKVTVSCCGGGRYCLFVVVVECWST